MGAWCDVQAWVGCVISGDVGTMCRKEGTRRGTNRKRIPLGTGRTRGREV